MHDTLSGATWFQMMPSISQRSQENPNLAYFQNQFAANLLVAMFGNPPSEN